MTYHVELFGVYTGVQIRVNRTHAVVEETEHNETEREQIGLGRRAFIKLTFGGREVQIRLRYFRKLIGEWNGLDGFLESKSE